MSARIIASPKNAIKSRDDGPTAGNSGADAEVVEVALVLPLLVALLLDGEGQPIEVVVTVMSVTVRVDVVLL